MQHYVVLSQHSPACLGADANEAAVLEIKAHDNDFSSWQNVVPYGSYVNIWCVLHFYCSRTFYIDSYDLRPAVYSNAS